MSETMIVAVTKVEALVKIPAVAGTGVPSSQSVEIEAENLSGDMVRFRRPTKEAPTIGTLMRVTIEEDEVT